VERSRAADAGTLRHGLRRMRFARAFLSHPQDGAETSTLGCALLHARSGVHGLPRGLCTLRPHFAGALAHGVEPFLGRVRCVQGQAVAWRELRRAVVANAATTHRLGWCVVGVVWWWPWRSCRGGAGRGAARAPSSHSMLQAGRRSGLWGGLWSLCSSCLKGLKAWFGLSCCASGMLLASADAATRWVSTESCDRCSAERSCDPNAHRI